MTLVESQLSALGLTLPDAGGVPTGNLVGAVQTGNLVFVSARGPISDGAFAYTGTLGLDLDVAAGYEAARQAALNALATLKQVLGDLDRITRIVKVVGIVRSTPEFAEHPQVANGASDLLVQVFGERGRHARTAMGVSALPHGLPVEIEVIAEVS